MTEQGFHFPPGKDLPTHLEKGVPGARQLEGICCVSGVSVSPTPENPGPREKCNDKAGMGSMLSPELGVLLNLCPPLYAEPRSGFLCGKAWPPAEVFLGFGDSAPGC